MVGISAATIWGFGVAGCKLFLTNVHYKRFRQHTFLVSLNSARDIGGRILAVAIWGSEGEDGYYAMSFEQTFIHVFAAAGGRYAAIAALTNIPAFIFAVFLYEIFLTDSDRGGSTYRSGIQANTVVVVTPAQLDFFRYLEGHGRGTITNAHNEKSDMEHMEQSSA